jgi:tetratricopeptide (TPR) repeat protein
VSTILDRHRERFRADAGDKRAFEALEEALFVAGDWDGLVEIYTHRVSSPDLAQEPAERARLLTRLGQVYGERRGDAERAAECFRAAVSTDAACRGALVELRRLHAGRQQWDVVLQIAEAEAALEMPGDERAALLADVGGIWLEQLSDAEQALEHFQRALEHDPRQATALAGAARASHALGQTEKAAAFWGRLAECERGPARARALVARAGLLAASSGETQSAADLYRRALTEDPENSDALDALSAIAEATRQWQLLAELHQRRFELSREVQRQAGIALSAARLHLDHLDSPEQARVWLQRAVELDSSDPLVYRTLAELERSRGDDVALRRALELQLERCGERPGLACLLELAQLQSEAGEDELALTQLERALALAPHDALVVEALSDTLTRLGRYEQLADCLERRAALAATDPLLCAGVLAELGSVYDDQLGDLEAARQAYERALQADPATPGVTDKLERIYRKSEAWQPLRGLLEQAGRMGPRDRRGASLCSLGELLAERFEDREGAHRAFEAALALDPACAEAHRGRQRLATEGGDPETLLRAYRSEAEVCTEPLRRAHLVREIVGLLEPLEQREEALAWAQRWMEAAPGNVEAMRLVARLHEQSGHVAEVLEQLERLDPLLQSGEQAANRRRMAALFVAQGQSERATAMYRAALEVDPADVEALRGLVKQLEENGRPEELAQALQSLSELVSGPEEQRACLASLVQLREERLGDIPGAIDALERLAALQDPPAEVEVHLEALLERASRHEELVERLARRARRLDPESPETVSLEVRRARILLEHLSRFGEATEVYRSLLERDPGLEAAREGLERALRASGDAAGLAAFLVERIERSPEPAERDALTLERAVILEEVLHGVDEAVQTYRQLAVSATQPETARRAASRLETLLERTGDWTALREHWERLLEVRPEEERPALHERLARLCRDRLRDAEGAATHLEAAAALCPERVELWRSLALLYETAQRPADLVRVLEAELAAGVGEEREQAICSRAGQLWAGVLDDPERALPHFQRLLEARPGDSAASEFLMAHYEKLGDFEGIARVLERRLAALDAMPRDPSGEWAAQRTSLRLRIAGLHAGPLDDPDGAIAALEPALAEIGPQTVVAEPLADLYQRTGYRDELIGLCRQAGEASPAGPERANWFARLADALRQRGDLRDAAAAYREVLDQRADDTEARAALRELYRRLEESEPLARLLETDLERLAGPDEIPVRLELARLFTVPLARPGRAVDQLRRVVQLDPSHADALERGLELAEHLQRHDVTEELLDAALARPQPNAVRSRLLAHRGQLLSRDPGRTDRAIADFREAASLDPSRGEVRQALRALFETLEQWEGVLDCLHQESQLAEPARRADLYERGAEIAWQHLSPQAALPWLERLRRQRPGDAGVIARIGAAHKIAGRPGAHLRALEEQIALGPDDATCRDLHRERARILERQLDAPSRAASALEEARRLCPADGELLGELDRLYRSLDRERERADVLESLVEVTPAGDRVSLLCEAASLCGERLAEPQRAAALLLQAVAETPTTSALRAELLRALGDALLRTGPPDAWCRCAEAELDALDPAAAVFHERRLQLHRELAAAYGRQGCLDPALVHLRRLADDAPNGLAPGEPEHQALLHGLRIQGNWVELEQRLAEGLDRRPDDAEGWLELARLRDERLCAPEAAAAAYRRLLECDPAHLPGLRGLRSAAERVGAWEEVARTLELELEHPETRDAARRSALLQRLGDVCWGRLRSTTRASRSYAAALEARPDNFAAHRALERLLEAMEDWRGAADLYESEVEVLGEREPERRQQAWLRAGEIARDHLHDEPRSLRAYVQAAATAPLALPRLAEQAELHRRCGEIEAFAEVFGRWCDAPETPAGAADQLRLAETLESLGRAEAAQARVERALELDANAAPAWDAAARLHEARGNATQASQALERAAELAADGGAAERLRRAAELREPGAPDAALELLRRAADLDAGAAGIQAQIALLALRRESLEEAEGAAARALELDGADPRLAPDQKLAVALAGGRAARRSARAEAAARFYAAALEAEPRHPEALAGAGETLVACGDLAAARAALETRLEIPEPDPDAALHRALLARCLREAGEPEAALAQCEAALAVEPGLEEAHELCVELHEAADAMEPGVAALERWARAGQRPADRAARLLRAAEWELRAPGHERSAEAHLREALAADSGLGAARQQLAALLWSQERVEETLEATPEDALRALAPEKRSTLWLLRGHALELAGRRDAAAQAFGAACEDDLRCVEAAISRARLLRAAGQWREAADTLDGFARRHPGDDEAGLAEVLHQLGRLLAGPLEDLERAIEVYRRCVEIEPDRVETRTTLAQLLGHLPDGWHEALDHHRAALDRDPTHAASLRGALRIACEHGSEAARAEGRRLLRALGLASPADADPMDDPAPLAPDGNAGLEGPVGEALRHAVHAVAAEIGSALGAPERPGGVDEGLSDPVARFRAATLEAEARLTAPALLPLSTPELRDVLTCVATLALEPEEVRAPGAMLNALDAAIGRRARRRLRRALAGVRPEQVEALDFRAWRSEVRGLAASEALAATGADLRTALLALVCETTDRSPAEIGEAADLTPLVDSCPEAGVLLRRVLRSWLREI